MTLNDLYTKVKVIHFGDQLVSYMPIYKNINILNKITILGSIVQKLWRNAKKLEIGSHLGFWRPF